jgi:hypothetical protein
LGALACADPGGDTSRSSLPRRTQPARLLRGMSAPGLKWMVMRPITSRGEQHPRRRCPPRHARSIAPDRTSAAAGRKSDSDRQRRCRRRRRRARFGRLRPEQARSPGH